MAPYGSAIQAWPSGQIMATPMIARQFITVIGQARIARRAALKPVFSQLDPRLRQFRHAGYAVSLGLPPTTLTDTRLLPGAKLDGLHVCSEASQWRAKIWL